MVTLEVSKKNYNRVRCQTHTLPDILRREGFEFPRELYYAVYVDGKAIPFSSIKLIPRKRED